MYIKSCTKISVAALKFCQVAPAFCTHYGDIPVLHLSLMLHGINTEKNPIYFS